MWCFLQNEMARFIYATYSQKLSLKTSREIKKGLTQIHHKKSSFSKDSAELWETNSGGGFWAATMGGAVTGFGAGDIYATPYSGDLIIDDPQKPSDSFYETMRQNVIENFSQTFWSRRNNQDKIPIIIIQQRVHTDDLSGWLMRDSKFRYTNYKLTAIDNITNQATFPERVSLETLLELKKASPYTFAAQQQQEPQSFSGNFFITDKTRIISANEFREKEWLMKFFIRSWDFAGVKKSNNKPSEKNDYTRGVLCCTDGEFLYILDVKSHHGTVDQNEILLVKTAQSDGWKTMITVPEDPGSAGQHYVDYLQSLQQLSNYTLNSIRPTHNKQLRAAPFASFLNMGKVIIVSDEEDVEKWNVSLLEELASFPYGIHDDQIDCLSDAFSIIHNVKKYL
jgi:predicted phage terminase large subunit-like protein